MLVLYDINDDDDDLIALLNIRLLMTNEFIDINDNNVINIISIIVININYFANYNNYQL